MEEGLYLNKLVITMNVNNTYLSKVFHFCAAHKYGNENWSDEKNKEVFGKDVMVHGHNYELHITVKGDLNPDTGFIVDLEYLKKLVKENVISKLDHTQFEKDVAWFKGRQPSTENLVVFIWESIEKDLEGCFLHRIRLIETPTIYTDYYGE